MGLQETIMEQAPATTLLIPCIWSKTAIAFRLLSAQYAGAFSGQAVTNEQVCMLLILHGAGEQTHRSLGQILGLEKSTMSRNIGHLLQKGWIAAGKGTDRREVRLALTTEGKRKVKTLFPLWKKKQEEVEALLGTELVASLDTLLLKLRTLT